MPARFTTITGLLALALGVSPSVASAQQVKTVFVIAMENTNWTQNARQFAGSQQQIFQNPAGPWLNALVSGGLVVTINGVPTNLSAQTSFATHYHNVGSNPAGTALHIHPSEPNYIWAEGGSNFGVLNDNQPFGSGGTNQNTTAHLVTLLTNAGKTWRSYQEDIDLVPSSGGINTPGANSLTSTVAAQSAWTVPLTNFSGTSASYVNPYNGRGQYDYAAKHNPMAFFTDSNGGNNNTNTNPLRLQYAPLQQFAADLANNAVANYNWITPNQFNDMHSALSGSFTYNGVTYLNNSNTSGAEKIAQGDNFLSQIVPMIVASPAYQSGTAAIVLWWDESEPDGSTNQDDFSHTIPEIVISPLAHPNVNGVPYPSTVDYTHSSDLRAMQKVFGVDDSFLLDAAFAPDLADLFAPEALNGPLSVARSGFIRDRRTGHYVQQVTVTNTGTTALTGPVFVILDSLSAGATLVNATGVTNNPPAGSVYVSVPGIGGALAPGASAAVILDFTDPTNQGIAYTPRVLHGNVNP
jgi:phosphatidylinositol-3-phosphatase